MSIDATRWAWKVTGVTSSERLVLLSMADRADEVGRCFPSARRLSVDTCLNRKTVLSTISSLITKGLVIDTGDRVGNGVRVLQLVRVAHREDEATDPKIGTSTNIGTGPKNGTATDPKNGTATDPNIGTQNLSGNLSGNQPDMLPPAAVATDGVRLCPHKEIIALYHEHLPQLPRVRGWPEHRAKMLRTRWLEDPSRQSLDWWEKFFKYIARSNFLMGRSDRDFQATLEWIIRPKNIMKIIEGNYHRERAA